MSGIVISGDTSGAVTLQAPAVAGTSTQTLVAVSGTLAPIVSGTAVASTSGTLIDFTGIPSWAKRITVMFQGVSTSGTSPYLIQVGSGSVTTTGYLGASSNITTAVSSANFTTGFGINEAAATRINHGAIQLLNLTSNIWVASGVMAQSGAINTYTTGGSVSIAGALDRVRITTVGGTDTFDAGSINIMWE